MNQLIERFIVHWAAAPWTWGVKDIERIHVQQNGWPRIAYARVILNELSHDIKVADHSKLKWSDLVKATIHLDDDKWLENNEIGYHSAEMNKTSVGICLIAGPKNPPSILQLEALHESLKILVPRFRLTHKNVYGHRDFGLNPEKGLALANSLDLTAKASSLNTTECPGDIIYNVVERIREGTLAL